MASAWAVRQVVERAVALGLVDRPADGELPGSAADKTLDYYGEPDARALLGLLSDLGIVYEVDYKTFRGLGDSTDDERLAMYRRELEVIAGKTRGRIAISDVELVDVEGRQRLRFRRDGQPVEWPVYPGPDEDFDALLTFTTYLDDLVPATSPERWCSVESPHDPDEAPAFIFADPAALAELARPFDLTFSPNPDAASGDDAAASAR